MSEPARRVHLFTLSALDGYNTRPTDAVYSAANTFENVISLWDASSHRFDLIEVTCVFSAPSSASIVVVPWLSRVSPTPGINPVADSADKWRSYGPQTAYGNPLTQDGGDTIRIETGGCQYVNLTSRSGGSGCSAEVYGIILFPGTR